MVKLETGHMETEEIRRPSAIGGDTQLNDPTVDHVSNHDHCKRPFLNKTYLLVDDHSTDEIVQWSEDGSSFVILHIGEFSDVLLPQYFRHSNFASFVRQLNTYGFKKVSHDKWLFGHPKFRRGAKYQLGQIQRKAERARGKKEKEEAGASKLSSAQGEEWQQQLQSLQLTVSALQQKLAAAGADNNRLSREVDELRRQNHHLSSRMYPSDCCSSDTPSYPTCSFSQFPPGYMHQPPPANSMPPAPYTSLTQQQQHATSLIHQPHTPASHTSSLTQQQPHATSLTHQPHTPASHTSLTHQQPACSATPHTNITPTNQSLSYPHYHSHPPPQAQMLPPPPDPSHNNGHGGPQHQYPAPVPNLQPQPPHCMDSAAQGGEGGPPQAYDYGRGLDPSLAPPQQSLSGAGRSSSFSSSYGSMSDSVHGACGADGDGCVLEQRDRPQLGHTQGAYQFPIMHQQQMGPVSYTDPGHSSALGHPPASNHSLTPQASVHPRAPGHMQQHHSLNGGWQQHPTSGSHFPAYNTPPLPHMYPGGGQVAEDRRPGSHPCPTSGLHMATAPGGAGGHLGRSQMTSLNSLMHVAVSRPEHTGCL